MKATQLVEEVILVAKIEVLEIVSDDADGAVLGEDEVREKGKRPERDEERNRVLLQPRVRAAEGFSVFGFLMMLSKPVGMRRPSSNSPPSPHPRGSSSKAVKPAGVIGQDAGFEPGTP